MNEVVTAAELKNSCDFSKEIDGILTSIREGHELFESNFQSWLDREIFEEWDDNEEMVTMSPANSEAFRMTKEEYEKL